MFCKPQNYHLFFPLAFREAVVFKLLRKKWNQLVILDARY